METTESTILILAARGALASELGACGITPRGLEPLLRYAAASRLRWADGILVALDPSGAPLVGRHGVPEGAARVAADLGTEYPEFFTRGNCA